MKPRNAKSKGTRLEKAVMLFFQALGWKARKQPGSGIYQGFDHDVYAESPDGRPWIIECKSRKAPLVTVHRWIGKADILVVREDRGESLYIMREAAFADLARRVTAAREIA